MIEFITNIDKDILLFIQEFIRCDFLNKIMIFLTTLGNSGFIWIALGVILIAFKKSRKIGVLVLCTLILEFTINDLILKNLVERVRPFNQFSDIIPLVKKPTSFSFPSGHTASSFAAAGILFLYTKKKYGIPALILAILIGFSRLYVGVHFPTDVFVGCLVGCLSSYVVYKVDKKCVLFQV